MNGKPNLLVIGPTPPPHHGVATATQLLCDVLRRQGYPFVFLNTSDRRGSANIGRLDVWNVALAIEHLIRFLFFVFLKRPQGVYIPISQNVLGTLRDSLFLVPARLLHLKIIVHLHGSAFRDFYESASGGLKRILKWIFKEVACAIVLGDCLRPIFHDLVPSERIRAIPNGIRDDFAESFLAGAYPNAERVRVVFLGTLIPEKGIGVLLESIPLALEQIPLANFILAGEIPTQAAAEEIQNWIKLRGLEDCVELPGILTGERKRQLLGSADIFVFPSIQKEGHPYVILEAMSAGLPVLTTDRGAISETVLDGVNGWLIPAGDPVALSEKIIELSVNADLRCQLGEASRARFLAHYTLDRWSADMLRAFDDVLNK
jgi:glycosyltransferase involved in cell wall biosynthesis